MCPGPRQGATSAEFSGPQEAAALVLQARAIAGAGDAARRLMSGRKLALLSPSPGDDSASELAAVPLKTKKTSQSVSNRSRMRSHTRCVQESSPYAGSWPLPLASRKYFSDSGQKPA